jgi:hypothetical protein
VFETVNDPVTAADGVDAIDLPSPSATAEPAEDDPVAQAPNPDAPLDYDRLRAIRAEHIDDAVDGDTSACFAFGAPIEVVVWLGGTLELRDDMIDDMLASFDECGIDPLAVLAEAEAG